MSLHVQRFIRNGRQFAGSLSPYYLKIEKVGERDVDFAQLLQAFVTPSIVLDELLQNITPPVKHSASVRLDSELLYARVPPTFVGFVLSFDGSAKTAQEGGFEGCSWILWKLPE